jgi:translation initiation factor 2-alpha kinase 4
VYAIKRIELNPRSKQLNRKITREVKLLSRLNHENVVRYYNSWIESATTEPASELNSTAPSCTSSHISKVNSNQVSISSQMCFLSVCVGNLIYHIYMHNLLCKIHASLILDKIGK